jgi:hypothetical protein
MSRRFVKAPRDRHIGRRLDKLAASEAEHFMACPNGGAILDIEPHRITSEIRCHQYVHRSIFPRS